MKQGVFGLIGRRPRAPLVAIVSALLVAGPTPVAPAVIPVGGACTLADAIDAANNDDDSGGLCPPGGSGADTLQLSGDVALSSVDNLTEGANGLPSIASEITLEGGGFTVERDPGAPSFRLFHVADAGDLTLVDVTVAGGRLTGSDASGGGIFNRGALTLSNSTLTGNTLTPSGSGYGGGLFNVGSAVLLSSTVSDNQIDAGFAYGGGISSGNYADASAVLEMELSRVSGNSASGLYVAGVGIDTWGIATLTQSTVADNSGLLEGDNAVLYGAGINAFGNLTLARSTVSGNSGYAGADAGSALLFGGGLAVQDGILNVSSSTISSNTLTAGAVYAGAQGGGVEHLTNIGTMSYSTLSGNSVAASYAAAGAILVGLYASLNLVGTLVGHSAGGNCDGFGTLTDIQHNLADDGTCGTVPATLTGLDPMLLDNGGPTPTHALLEGSSAIDHAGMCGISTDQRGVERDDPYGCDSGAYEVNDCLAPDSYQATVEGLISDLTEVEVCRTIDTGESLTVAAPEGALILRAGVIVTFGDGTVVEEGAELRVEIDPSLNM